MSPTGIRAEIERLLGSLLEHDLAIITRPVVAEHHHPVVRVTWEASGDGAPFLDVEDFSRLVDWRHAVENGHYSVMLGDGSLLQISYVFRRNELESHRLAYLPCPLQFAPGDLREEGDVLGIYEFWLQTAFEDSLGRGRLLAARRKDEAFDVYPLSGREAITELAEGEGLSDALESNADVVTAPFIALRSPMRFDYDPGAAGVDHPAGHLHVSHQQCRIPVFGPVSLGHFVRFVFRHFYPDDWRVHGFLRDWPMAFWSRSVTPTESLEMYVDCGQQQVLQGQSAVAPRRQRRGS